MDVCVVDYCANAFAFPFSFLLSISVSNFIVSSKFIFFFDFLLFNKCYGSASLTMFLTQTSLELLSSEASVIHSRNRTCTT